MNMGKEDAKAQFEEDNEPEEKPTEILEDWKAKKTWKGHKHSKFFVGIYLIHFLAVTDIAWSPDNLHFASCGVDSFIHIWNINEHSII